VPLGSAAVRALLILAGMVVLLAIGVVPPAVAALLAAIAMTLSGVITEQQAIRSVSWQTIILIGGLIPLSTALKESGAADDIAKIMVDIVGTGRPYLLLLALFVLTAALSQVVSNTATALIVAPIAAVAAANAGVSVRPMLMVIAVAGAASFLTPIASANNMMVMGPGGYRFGDFWRLGLPLILTWLIIALAVIPLAWPF
jgi:di/tricarboxylate transporter